jgi:hypothetical protein
VACVVVVAVWGHLNRSASADDRVNPAALAFKGFTDRVKDYVALQKTLESALPKLKPSNDPADIEAHRTTLAAALRKARQDAKRGEILTAAGFDQDQSFMLNEIAGDDLYFQVVTRLGKTVDSGSIHRQAKPVATAGVTPTQ